MVYRYELNRQPGNVSIHVGHGCPNNFTLNTEVAFDSPSLTLTLNFGMSNNPSTQVHRLTSI